MCGQAEERDGQIPPPLCRGHLPVRRAPQPEGFPPWCWRSAWRARVASRCRGFLLGARGGRVSGVLCEPRELAARRAGTAGPANCRDARRPPSQSHWLIQLSVKSLLSFIGPPERVPTHTGGGFLRHLVPPRPLRSLIRLVVKVVCQEDSSPIGQLAPDTSSGLCCVYV